MQEAVERQEDAPKVPKGPASIPKMREERFYCIKVALARDKFDIPVPVVQVGNKANKGPRIQLKRGVWVPVSEGVVEVLQHSTYMVWQNVEGEDRKVGTERVRYPLDGKIEITKKGYEELRKKAMAADTKEKEITEQGIEPYRV